MCDSDKYIEIPWISKYVIYKSTGSVKKKENVMLPNDLVNR